MFVYARGFFTSHVSNGWRYQLLATNTPRTNAQFLEARHRPHARVEDNIGTGKQTGLGHLPSSSIEVDRTWCPSRDHRLRPAVLATPALPPKILRYRLLHIAGRIIRGQRKRKIRIPATWPWAQQLAACLLAALALPPPTRC